jgi:Leucine Rich repeats (2 copies)
MKKNTEFRSQNSGALTRTTAQNWNAGRSPFTVHRSQFTGGAPKLLNSEFCILNSVFMNSEEAYAEALRRVRKAEASGATALDLSGAPDLKQLPRELEQLTRLKKLYLSFCEQLVDLSPLAGLRGLQTLELVECSQLSDLRPLAELRGLQTLDLSGCKQLRDLSPLAGLTGLQTLDLAGCWLLSDLRALAGLRSLQELHVSFCEPLSDLSFAGRADGPPDTRHFLEPAVRRLEAAGRVECPSEPWPQFQAGRRLEPSDRADGPPGARPLRLRSARRLEAASRADLASRALPFRVRAAQRPEPAGRTDRAAYAPPG